MLVSNESRHCPRCDALVPQVYPHSMITRYYDKLIEFLLCRCGMPFSREVWRV